MLKQFALKIFPTVCANNFLHCSCHHQMIFKRLTLQEANVFAPKPLPVKSYLLFKFPSHYCSSSCWDGQSAPFLQQKGCLTHLCLQLLISRLKWFCLSCPFRWSKHCCTSLCHCTNSVQHIYQWVLHWTVFHSYFLLQSIQQLETQQCHKFFLYYL